MNTKEVKESDLLIFLGDTFDLMIGDHNEYLEKYHFFFDSLKEKIKSNQKIIYFEGNHDFHLENIFKKNFKENFEYIKDEKLMKFGDKIFYFQHGDQLDFDNKSYILWKKIYTSPFFKLLVNKILPFKLIENIGERASLNSKKRSTKPFNYDEFKKKYRLNFQKISEIEADVFIMGHTHILEDYQYNGKYYYNNGFPKKDKKFIFINNGEVDFISFDK